MKKTLVAVAALAAFAGAHADVHITGLVEAGVLVPTTGTAKSNRFASGGNGGSEITFAVGEDLGSGLKADASVTLINNPFSSSASGDPLNGAHAAAAEVASNAVRTYNSFIGLSNEIGSLKLGSLFTPAFFVANSGDPFGQAVGTYNLAGTTAGTAMTYGSINVAANVSGVGVAYQANVDNTVNSYSLTYSAGALNVGYAAQSNTNAALSAVTTQTQIGGNYDFGIVKLFALMKSESGKKDASSVGISAPVGPVLVAYSISAQSGVNNQSNLGVFYPLSKRTTIGWVNYNAGEQKTGDNLVTIGTGNFVGIKHTF